MNIIPTHPHQMTNGKHQGNNKYKGNGELLPSVGENVNWCRHSGRSKEAPQILKLERYI